MASHLYRTATMRPLSAYVPILTARASASQTTSTASTSGGASQKPTDKQFRTQSTNDTTGSGSSKAAANPEGFLSTPVGRYGSLILLTVGIYAGYKMISERSGDLKKDEHYKRATADYQKANTQGTDVKK